MRREKYVGRHRAPTMNHRIIQRSAVVGVAAMSLTGIAAPAFAQPSPIDDDLTNVGQPTNPIGISPPGGRLIPIPGPPSIPPPARFGGQEVVCVGAGLGSAAGLVPLGGVALTCAAPVIDAILNNPLPSVQPLNPIQLPDQEIPLRP